MLCSAINRCKIGPPPDIHRQHIEFYRWTISKQNAFIICIDARCFGMNEACIGHCRQFWQINMDISFGPDTFNKGWQHTRIRRVDIAADKGQSKAGQGPHGKRFKRSNLRVAAAKQHQFTADRRTGLHQDPKALICPLK